MPQTSALATTAPMQALFISVLEGCNIVLSCLNRGISGVIQPKCSYKHLFHHLFILFLFYVLLTPHFPCSFALIWSWVFQCSVLFKCTLTKDLRCAIGVAAGLLLQIISHFSNGYLLSLIFCLHLWSLKFRWKSPYPWECCLA